ncbi:PAS domain S-box protein [bacterium]|nr:PAS domain S-box protein [bacterium]
MALKDFILNEKPLTPGFSRKNLLFQTIFPVCLTIILFVCATFFVAVPALKDNLVESKKEMIRELTNTVWSLLASYDQKVKSGEISLEEAQTKMLSHIYEIRYGNESKDYFWIIDLNHHGVMHPYQKDLDGRNLFDFQDNTGKYFIQEFVDTAKTKGQGYVEYTWQWQDNPQSVLPKLSFVKVFKPWGWVIGTGIYLVDVDSKINSISSQYQLLLIGILIVIVIISTYIIRQARKQETERYMSRKLWHESESRYQTLIESMNEGMAIQDETDTIVFVNESFSRILGYHKDELIGRNLYELVDETNAEILREQTGKRAKNLHSSLYELCWKGKNGENVFTLISGHPYFDRYHNFSGTFALVVDITEQKKKDLSVKESEAKFRASFEASPNLILIFKVDKFQCIDVNDGFLKLSGYSREEIVGRTLAEFVLWADQKQKNHILERIRNLSRLVDKELKILCKDGSVSTIVISTRSIYLNDVHHIVCFGRDITAKIEAEEKYHSILNSMKDGYFEIDLRGRCLLSNDAFGKIMGCSPEETLTLDHREHLTIENTDRVDRIFSQIYQSGESIDVVEVEFIKKDGATVYSEFSAALVKNAKGEATGFSCIIRDITARKKSEETMNQMRLYLKNTIDSMPSIIMVFNKELIVTQWNLEAEKATGIPFYTAQGRSIKGLLPKCKSMIDKITSVLDEQQSLHIDKYQVIEDDGQLLYFDVLIYPFNSDFLEGGVLRMDDISARIRMEERMIQSEKMMSVGELAAGTAHEINNPLGGILHGAQNIIRRLSADRERNREIAGDCGVDLDNLQRYLERQKILHYLEGIRESGMRAADIVSRMLQFSRVSHSEKTRVPIPDMIEKSIGLAESDYDLKKKYDFKKVEIERIYEEGLLPVSCTETEIEQVLLNIIKNSAQAMATMPENGHQPKMTIRVSSKDDIAEIGIADNGPGMEESVRKRVFEPFFTTKPIGEGTGLGLSVSYMIITTNHNGTIEVSSVPNRGTTFTVRLPYLAPLGETVKN